MKIILKGAPRTTNTLYATACRGSFPTRFMSKLGKELKESYRWQAKSQFKQPILRGNLEVEAKIYLGSKRKADIDNFNKILYDSLTGIIWEDDSQIIKATTWKLYSKEDPRIELDILSVDT